MTAYMCSTKYLHINIKCMLWTQTTPTAPPPPPKKQDFTWSFEPAAAHSEESKHSHTRLEQHRGRSLTRTPPPPFETPDGLTPSRSRGRPCVALLLQSRTRPEVMPESLHTSAAAAAVYWQTYGAPAHLISRSSYFISDTLVTLQSAGEGFIYNKDILGETLTALTVFSFMLCYIFFFSKRNNTVNPSRLPPPPSYSVISS